MLNFDTILYYQQLQNMTILLMLLLALLHFNSAQCPANTIDSTIYTKVVNLVTLSQFTFPFVYTHTFTSPYSETPYITAGISDFQVDFTLESNFPSFWFTPKVSLTDLRIISMPSKSSWHINRLSVIVTINTQLFLDLVSSTIQKTLSSSNTYKFKLNTNNSFLYSTSIIIRTFLAGFNSTDNLSYIQLGSSTVLNNQLQLSLSTTTQSDFTIQVAVVAFPQKTNSFVVYGNSASITSPSTTALDLFQSLSASQNIFYGLNALKIQKRSGIISFKSQISVEFILTMTLQGEASFQLSYFFLGHSAETVCSTCQLLSLGFIYSQGLCVKLCPPLTVQVNLGNAKICRPCPSALNLGFSSGKCVQCNNDTIATNGVCVPKNSTTLSTDASSFSQQSISGTFIFNSISEQPPQKNSTIISSLNLSHSKNSTLTTNTHSNPNSFQFSKPQSQTPTSNSSILGLAGQSYSQTVQCPLPNMFWNGNQCACVVGYALVANICVKIFIPNIQIVTINNINQSVICQGQNQYYNGSSCNCLPGYFYLNGICTICPPQSIFNGQYCICISGYYLLNSTCVQNKSISCPLNSKDNGQGVCVCSQANYILVNNVCQPITCGTLKYWNGSACTCDNNKALTLSNGTCQPRCSNNQQWSPVSQSCLNICGVNMRFDSQQQKCVCIDGFAYGIANQCQQCQTTYFPFNGFCITCPSFSFFSNNYCVCQEGYMQMPDGICRPKCSNLQIYNPITTQCECMSGLVLINDTCNLCPSNTSLRNGICVPCPNNSQLVGGRCVCLQGFISDATGQLCIFCSTYDTYILDGYCIKCPKTLIFNRPTNKCVCPQGTILQNSKCVPACKTDQIYDPSTGCYSCGLNMVISGEKCVCAKGYVDVGCGCKLSCAANQFIFAGVCAQCPPNTVYMPAVQGCVCLTGYYFSDIFNQCIKYPIIIQCNLGQYLDTNTNQCLSCQPNCYNCTSSICLQCVSGYQLFNNSKSCQTVCGDGIIAGLQQCDSGSQQQLGCVACSVVTGYTCTGQPSICRQNTPNPLPQSDSLLLKTSPQVNTNNIFLTFVTTPTFTFPNQTTMKSFIQASFVNTVRPTVYCMQQASTLSVFNCLLIYPNGVPNNSFNVSFSYNYQDHSAKTTVTINPLAFSTLLTNRQT